jgi:acyl-coenzyme A thioesterase PaaI-like protein
VVTQPDIGARVAMATALRELGHALVSHDVPDAVLESLTPAIAAALDSVSSYPARSRPEDGMRQDVFAVTPADGDEIHHFDDCPVSGLANPFSMTIDARRQGDEVVARVVLGPAWEGAPGRSHGGPVAAMFDDVLGFLGTVHVVGTYAIDLDVKYRAPFPLSEEVVVRAWVESRDDRRFVTVGQATHRGHLVAEARCIGAIVGPERMGRPTYPAE